MAWQVFRSGGEWPGRRVSRFGVEWSAEFPGMTLSLEVTMGIAEGVVLIATAAIYNKVEELQQE